MTIPKIAKVLQGCVSAETAFVQNDYPYGRQLRCKRRNWLEFKPGKTGGFRYVHQTSDPKSSVERWNKPKLGTYTFLSVLVLTDEHCENGEPSAVSAFGLGLNDSEDALEAFMAAFGAVLDENQQKQADLLKKLIPLFGSKKTGRLYRVRDMTGTDIFGEPVTAGHPVFAATINSYNLPADFTMKITDFAMGEPNPIKDIEKIVVDLKRYNPPLQSIDEHRRFGLLDAYQIGKRLLVEHVSHRTVAAPSPLANANANENDLAAIEASRGGLRL